MTDTEIIKALECCTTKGAKCSDCPAYKKVDRSDCKKYFRGAIDLINRQKGEIERLNNNISVCQKPMIYNKYERICECGAIVKTYQKYCKDCGQALVWGDEND